MKHGKVSRTGIGVCFGPQNGGMFFSTKDSWDFTRKMVKIGHVDFNKTKLGNSLPNQSGLENRPFKHLLQGGLHNLGTSCNHFHVRCPEILPIFCISDGGQAAHETLFFFNKHQWK